MPDEKMCGQKAKMYLDGKTKLELGFYEMAYTFNYLKVRNRNSVEINQKYRLEICPRPWQNQL